MIGGKIRRAKYVKQYRSVLLNNVEGLKGSRITEKYTVEILAALDSGRARLIACTMDGIASR